MSNSKFATEVAQGFTRAKFAGQIVRMSAYVPIGGTGAVGTVTKDGPIDITRDSTGTYSLTFPKGADADVRVGIESALGTVVTAEPTAIDGNAGTATFVTRNAAGSATDPASGNILRIRVEVRTKW